jgi:predicted Zn-dependent protease
MGYGRARGGGGGMKLLPILLFLGYLGYYYFSNQQTVPITGRKQLVDISREQEAALGLQSFRQVLAQEQIVTSGPQAEAVRSIGQKLVAVSDDKNYRWEFVLINSREVNAFALPGGKVAVYAGLLPVVQNANALAAVLGHEIGHVIARHGAERMAQQRLVQLGSMAAGIAVSDMDPQMQRTVMGALGMGAQFGLLLPFSRDNENEADLIGVKLASRACFDPTEAPKLWDRMSRMGSGQKPPEFMSTHPSDSTRIRRLQELMPEALREREKYCGSSQLPASGSRPDY